MQRYKAEDQRIHCVPGGGMGRSGCLSAIGLLLVFVLGVLGGCATRDDGGRSASDWDDLGTAAVRQGQYARAEDHYRKALGMREERLGTSHLDTAWSANHLANALQEQSRHADAERMYRYAVDI